VDAPIHASASHRSVPREPYYCRRPPKRRLDLGRAGVRTATCTVAPRPSWRWPKAPRTAPTLSDFLVLPGLCDGRVLHSLSTSSCCIRSATALIVLVFPTLTSPCPAERTRDEAWLGTGVRYDQELLRRAHGPGRAPRSAVHRPPSRAASPPNDRRHDVLPQVARRLAIRSKEVLMMREAGFAPRRIRMVKTSSRSCGTGKEHRKTGLRALHPFVHPAPGLWQLTVLDGSEDNAVVGPASADRDVLRLKCGRRVCVETPEPVASPPETEGRAVRLVLLDAHLRYDGPRFLEAARNDADLPGPVIVCRPETTSTSSRSARVGADDYTPACFGPVHAAGTRRPLDRRRLRDAETSRADDAPEPSSGLPPESLPPRGGQLDAAAAGPQSPATSTTLPTAALGTSPVVGDCATRASPRRCSCSVPPPHPRLRDPFGGGAIQMIGGRRTLVASHWICDAADLLTRVAGFYQRLHRRLHGRTNMSRRSSSGRSIRERALDYVNAGTTALASPRMAALGSCAHGVRRSDSVRKASGGRGNARAWHASSRSPRAGEARSPAGEVFGAGSSGRPSGEQTSPLPRAGRSNRPRVRGHAEPPTINAPRRVAHDRVTSRAVPMPLRVRGTASWIRSSGCA